MKLSDFDYILPKELIAQTPLENRSESRLLTLDKRTGGLCHGTFADIADVLCPGDCLVINDTKVIPARLVGESRAARAELLLLRNISGDTWEALASPGKKTRRGDEILFGGGLLKACVESVTDEGNRLIRFEYDGVFNEILDSLGEMPLPPYITEKLADKDRYQTVYASNDGSAAAPTAGLHFTGELLRTLRDKGVFVASVTLHVGLGTFRPVHAEDITGHKMHSEFCIIEPEQARVINNARKNGGRIVAVGTTSCRVLESRAVFSEGEGSYAVEPGSGFTDIFIYPPYNFKLTDALITNFHLPKSTLIMLVSALAGRENVLAAYNTAVSERYRFFSFGDAMLIV